MGTPQKWTFLCSDAKNRNGQFTIELLSVTYTSPAALAFIKEKDKDINSDYCKEIEADVAHIKKKMK